MLSKSGLATTLTAVNVAVLPFLSLTDWRTSNNEDKSSSLANESLLLYLQSEIGTPALMSLSKTSFEAMRMAPQSSDSITTIFRLVRQPGILERFLIKLRLDRKE